ncbi:hypothetical protein [Streptomyces sporangiiformans]|uniref:Uncharacterized protein n=1 Tax=Streptomyces sporangiiformans TaxID=2315329 RepID=A0A505DQU0_9ACTN|nr:hypothetical protein [Streptomyces sporangiiformans]TPQ23654.1 hypothetical protein FGD71_002700 [Streptomyces sporangiiformans]
MRTQSIGVGAIGVGMADRAHPGGCRTVPTVQDTGLPELCLVAVEEAHKALARDAARGYGSTDTDAGRGIVLPTTFLVPPPASETGRTGFSLISPPAPRA